MQRITWLALLVMMTTAPFAGAFNGAGPADGAKPEVEDGPGVAAAGCSLGLARITLTEGQTISGTLDNAVNANCEFQFDPDPNADIGRMFLNNLCCDFDVYVRRGAPPTTSLWECRPFTGGSADETCDLVVDGQTFYVMVRRFSSGGAFELTASSVVLPTLATGVPQVGNVAPSQMNLYKVLVPAGSSQLVVAVGGPDPRFACTGQVGAPLCAAATLSPRNADLYVRLNNIPTTLTTGSTCRSLASGSNDVCVLSNEANAAKAGLPAVPPVPGAPTMPAPSVVPFAGPGKYFVAVRGALGPADYAIVAAVA